MFEEKRPTGIHEERVCAGIVVNSWKGLFCFAVIEMTMDSICRKNITYKK